MHPSAMISFTSLSFGFLKKLRSERQKKGRLGEEGSRNRERAKKKRNRQRTRKRERERGCKNLGALLTSEVRQERTRAVLTRGPSWEGFRYRYSRSAAGRIQQNAAPDGGFDRAPRLEDAASICPSAWYQQWSCFILLFLTRFVP